MVNSKLILAASTVCLSTWHSEREHIYNPSNRDSTHLSLMRQSNPALSQFIWSNAQL